MEVWLLVTYLASQPAPELGPEVGGVPMSKSECQWYAAQKMQWGQARVCRSMKWNPEWGPTPSMAEPVNN
jgi:hypothetical protein